MLLQNDFEPIVARDLASSFLGSPRKSYTNYNLWTFFSRSLHTNSLRSYTMYVVNNFIKYQKHLYPLKTQIIILHIIKPYETTTVSSGITRIWEFKVDFKMALIPLWITSRTTFTRILSILVFGVHAVIFPFWP